MGAYETNRWIVERYVAFLQAAMRALPEPRAGISPRSTALKGALLWLRDARPDDCKLVRAIDVQLQAEGALSDALEKGWDGWAGETLYLPREAYDLWYLEQARMHYAGEPVSDDFVQEQTRRRDMLRAELEVLP